MDLLGRNVFLASSFPSGPSAEAVSPYDPSAIADAIAALFRTVVAANARLVFGGHPTISPMVLLLAAESDRKGAVEVYQSLWFEDQLPNETRELVERGFAVIRWCERRNTLHESLTEMRHRMLTEADAIGAIFIGGMDGLYEEFAMFGEIYPERPALPFAAPGGAARDIYAGLAHSAGEPDLASPHYPRLCFDALAVMARTL